MNTAKQTKESQIIDVDFSKRAQTLRNAATPSCNFRKKKAALLAEIKKS